MEQLCHKEFAKFGSPLPLLLAMYSQRLGHFFRKQTRECRGRFKADLGHQVSAETE